MERWIQERFFVIKRVCVWPKLYIQALRRRRLPVPVQPFLDFLRCFTPCRRRILYMFHCFMMRLCTSLDCPSEFNPPTWHQDTGINQKNQRPLKKQEALGMGMFHDTGIHPGMFVLKPGLGRDRRVQGSRNEKLPETQIQNHRAAGASMFHDMPLVIGWYVSIAPLHPGPESLIWILPS